MTPLRPTTLILFAATASVLLVAGCSQKNPGQANPQSNTGTATGTGTSAPPTAAGLDLTKFKDDPCGLLKTDQLAGLGTFKAPEPGSSSVGPKCRWPALDVTKGAAYTVTVNTNGNTFDQVSENVKGSKVYRQAKVADYPAVSSDPTNGLGNCLTAVGTSSKDVFFVQISTLNESTPEYQDSCGTTERVAALVVQNLKG
jgi:hypothetical protein